MTINTKYEIGQEVYYLMNGSIEKTTIVNTYFNAGNTNPITYTLAKVHNSVQENLLYLSKEELALVWLKQQGLELSTGLKELT